MNNKIKRIYISGPFSAKTSSKIKKNVEKVLDIGIEIIKKGHIPFMPHLLYFLGEYAEESNKNFNYDVYMSWGLYELDHSDALYFIGPSPGANLELEFAKKKGISIYYSLGEVPDLNKKERKESNKA